MDTVTAISEIQSLISRYKSPFPTPHTKSDFWKPYTTSMAQRTAPFLIPAKRKVSFDTPPEMPILIVALDTSLFSDTRTSEPLLDIFKEVAISFESDSKPGKFSLFSLMRSSTCQSYLAKKGHLQFHHLPWKVETLTPRCFFVDWTQRSLVKEPLVTVSFMIRIHWHSDCLPSCFTTPTGNFRRFRWKADALRRSSIMVAKLIRWMTLHGTLPEGERIL